MSCSLLGQPEAALHELTLMNDARRILSGAPTGKPMPLVSAMINVAIAGVYADTIAVQDGLHLHIFAQEPQLVGHPDPSLIGCGFASLGTCGKYSRADLRIHPICWK